ncbi:hypothetical protein BHM03_00032373 [Ensete ventricosum]|nr:hypothetical protein BHM03_00032373 [Ensete ventricosum]
MRTRPNVDLRSLSTLILTRFSLKSTARFEATAPKRYGTGDRFVCRSFTFTETPCRFRYFFYHPPRSPPRLRSLFLLRSRSSTSCCIFIMLCVSFSGVESFDVDLKEQKVTVKGNVEPEVVLQTVSKTGKKTSFWDAEPESKEATA